MSGHPEEIPELKIDDSSAVYDCSLQINIEKTARCPNGHELKVWPSQVDNWATLALGEYQTRVCLICLGEFIDKFFPKMEIVEESNNEEG